MTPGPPVGRRACGWGTALIGIVLSTSAVRGAPAVEPGAAASSPAGGARAEASAAAEPDEDARERKPERSPGEDDPLGGQLQLQARGIIVVNIAYANRRMLPGNYVLFGVPPSIGGEQFVVSPSNTTLGFTLTGVSYRQIAFSGALDLTLRSPSPLNTAGVLSPQFYDAEISARASHVTLRVGHLPDVISPFPLMAANGFPGGYMPGQLGFSRPQVRGDVRLPFTALFQVTLATSLSRPVTTLELAEETFAGGAGVPDAQGRLAFAAGSAIFGDPWKRPYELGVTGHFGRRAVVDLSGETVTGEEFDSWSLGADVRAEFPSGTHLKLRVWRGSVLGDFRGGVFQTVSSSLQTIDARGFAVAVGQRLGGRWELNAGFGRDDPENEDLDVGGRALNQVGWANAFWNWSKIIGFAVEGSRWRTDYQGQGSTQAWRGEILVLARF